MATTHNRSRWFRGLGSLLLALTLTLTGALPANAGQPTPTAGAPAAGITGAQINADVPAASLTRIVSPGIEIGQDNLADADVLLGDLDGDDLPDAVTGWGGIAAWQNPGDAFDSTWVSRTIAAPDNALPKALADMTGDGYAEVIVAKRMPNYTLAILVNDGTPFDGVSWAVKSLGDMPGHVTSVAVADINHDGRLEIIAGVDASGSANAIYALYCSSDDPLTGTWSRETLAEVTYTVNVLKVGDIDGDGWDDIVFGQPHAPAVGTLENPVDRSEWPDVYQLRALQNGGASGTWTTYDLGRDPAYFTLALSGTYHGFWGASINDLALADVDDDDDLDVVVAEGVEGDFNLAVWQNDGTPFDGNLWEGTTIGVGELGYYMADTLYGVGTADLDGDGWEDVVSGSGVAEDSEINYWTSEEQPFGTEIADTHWVRHDIEELGFRVDAVQLADLDGDGDTDIMGLVAGALWSDPHTLRIWQNVSGMAALLATDVAPDEIEEGEAAAMLRVQAAYHGVPGEAAIELQQWNLTLQDQAGTALTATQANDLLASLTVYADTDASGTWNAGDAAVATMATFSPASGVISLTLNSGNTVAPDGGATYWVVPELEEDIAEVGVSGLRIQFDPDEGATIALVGGGTAPTLMSTTPVVASSLVLSEPTALGLAISPAQIVANGTDTATVTVTVQSRTGDTVPGSYAVTLSTTLGSLPASPTVVTTTLGVATATLTAGTVVGVGQVQAALGAITATQAITLTAGNATTVDLSTNETELAANGTDTATLTATVRDAQGHAVTNGTAVTFTTTLGSLGASPYVTATSGGVATATLTAGTTLGDAKVVAQVGTITDTVTITLAAGPAAEVELTSSRSSMPADGSATAALTVTVSDAQGHAVADGTTVTVTTTLGSLGASPYVATTNGGIVTATLTAGTTAGDARVLARVGTMTDTVTIALLPGEPDDVAVTASRSSMPANGSSTAALTVTVSDSHGNPVANGTPVTVTTTLGSLGADPFVTVTSDGVATATLTAGTEVGDAEVVARVGAITDTLTISLTVGAAATVEIESSRSSMLADGSATAALTVTVSDAQGHAVADGTPVTVTTTLGDLGDDPFVTATSGGRGHGHAHRRD